jgi:hypothetical protein
MTVDCPVIGKMAAPSGSVGSVIQCMPLSIQPSLCAWRLLLLSLDSDDLDGWSVRGSWLIIDLIFLESSSRRRLG